MQALTHPKLRKDEKMKVFSLLSIFIFTYPELYRGEAMSISLGSEQFDDFYQIADTKLTSIKLKKLRITFISVSSALPCTFPRIRASSGFLLFRWA